MRENVSCHLSANMVLPEIWLCSLVHLKCKDMISRCYQEKVLHVDYHHATELLNSSKPNNVFWREARGERRIFL